MHMDTGKRVLSILRKADAIMTDNHFVYTSGRHGSVYVRKDRLYPHTKDTETICRLMAQDVKNMDIDVVVGPSLCGIILSHWVASILSKLTKREVLSVFTEKPSGDQAAFDRPQVFSRGYDQLVKGKRVLVVEDLTTTGASVKKVVEEVKRSGGSVQLVYVMVNRNPGGVNEQFMGAPFRSLAVLPADSYEETACPLCKRGVPVNTEVGHGKAFLGRKGSV